MWHDPRLATRRAVHLPSFPARSRVPRTTRSMVAGSACRICGVPCLYPGAPMLPESPPPSFPAIPTPPRVLAGSATEVRPIPGPQWPTAATPRNPVTLSISSPAETTIPPTTSASLPVIQTERSTPSRAIPALPPFPPTAALCAKSPIPSRIHISSISADLSTRTPPSPLPLPLIGSPEK